MIDIHSKKMQALALVKESRLMEARDLYASLCKYDSSDTESWFRLGTTNLQLDDSIHAEACFRRVIELKPNLDIAYYNLGRSLELQERDNEAIDVYRRLLQMKPNIDAYVSIGGIHVKHGRFSEALEIYRQGKQIQPDNFKLTMAEAVLYEKLGDYHEAYTLVQPFLEGGMETPEIALLLASLSRPMNCHEQAINMLERLLSKDDWLGNERILIAMHFALGKLLDAVGKYDRAFQHIRRGNELSARPVDSNEYVENADAIIRTFNKDFVQRSPHAAVRGDRLIFIVGMPRSGTTLVEQILSSHPQVYGGGELRDLSILANNIPHAQDNKHVFPDGVVFLSEDDCTELAKRYMKHVETLSGDAKYFTDKMPQNFQYIGLIAMLFPGAKVIHCVRDPLDTCLSCYFEYFYLQGSLAFTTDLANLGAYYKQYQRIMRHWKTTLDYPILDISYESLVENPERKIRQLLAFCELPWDDQCLKFYGSSPRRAVVTASYDQVRQPIYRKSLHRWKNYEQYLEPLKNALYK